MQAAIYARYSSENQRPESIDDQISSCRKLAKERQYDVVTSTPIRLRRVRERIGRGLRRSALRRSPASSASC